MAFTDAFERTLDAKNRTQIPADFRNAMDPEILGGTFYLCPGERPNTLSLLPEKYFDELADLMRGDLLSDDDAEAFETLFYSLSKKLDMDKQGRAVFPDRQLEMVDIGKEITVAGANRRINIWSTAEYKAYVNDQKGRMADLHKFAKRARLEEMRRSPEAR